MALSVWDEQRDALDHARDIANLGARIGRSVHRINSRGSGQSRIQQPIDLRVTFVEQPTFTSGVTLADGQKLVEDFYPLASIGVYAWRKDDRDFYTGAWIWVSVTVPPTLISNNFPDAEQALITAQKLNKLALEHHLCFEGMALRDIDPDKVWTDDLRPNEILRNVGE